MTKRTKAKQQRTVLVTTERRGVFCGRLVSYDEQARAIVLDDAKMAIYWGTTRGLHELAVTGPTSKSKISAAAPRARYELVECVIDVSPEAEAAWSRF